MEHDGEREAGGEPPRPLADLEVPEEVQLLCEVLRAWVEAVLPERCLPQALRCIPDGEGLIIEATDVRPGVGPAARLTAHLAPGAKIGLLCLGKCALGSALALRRLLGEHVGRTLVVDQAVDRGGVPLPGPPELEVLTGDHPLAGERSLAAGRRVRDFVSAALPGELLVACLSGGASALVDLPARGVPAEWLASVPAALMHAGVDVRDLLGVRAALSALKCGGLLERLPPGVTPLVLVLSDVSGDDPAEVGGAPFHPTVSTQVCDRLDRVLEQHGDLLPGAARTWISTTGRRRLRARHAQPAPHVVVAANAMARQAARAHAARRGLASEDLGERSGTPAEVAAALCAWARSSGAPLGVMGGEAVSAVRGSGRGGPNQEVVAACLAPCAQGLLRAVASIDTDGIDGSSDLAGAVAWPAMARRLAPAVEEALRMSDSASLFAEIGGLRWCATGANVSDLRVVLR